MRPSSIHSTSSSPNHVPRPPMISDSRPGGPDQPNLSECLYMSMSVNPCRTIYRTWKRTFYANTTLLKRTKAVFDKCYTQTNTYRSIALDPF